MVTFRQAVRIILLLNIPKICKPRIKYFQGEGGHGSTGTVRRAEKKERIRSIAGRLIGDEDPCPD